MTLTTVAEGVGVPGQRAADNYNSLQLYALVLQAADVCAVPGDSPDVARVREAAILARFADKPDVPTPNGHHVEDPLGPLREHVREWDSKQHHAGGLMLLGLVDREAADSFGTLLAPCDGKARNEKLRLAQEALQSLIRTAGVVGGNQRPALAEEPADAPVAAKNGYRKPAVRRRQAKPAAKDPGPVDAVPEQPDPVQNLDPEDAEDTDEPLDDVLDAYNGGDVPGDEEGAGDEDEDEEQGPAAPPRDIELLDDEELQRLLLAAEREDDRAMKVDSVGTWLRRASRAKLLTAEQEVDMAKAVEAGLYATQLLENAEETGEVLNALYKKDLQYVMRLGERAKNDFIEANLRLVISIAKRYVGRGMDFLDLIQEGNLGMIHALEKFDYHKGYKFSTYATWWIRQAVTRAMADQARTIRIPVHMVEVINKLRRVDRELLQDLGREPTLEELAKEMDLTPEKVTEIKQYSREPISLDQTIGHDGDAQLGDFIEDGQAVVAVDAVSSSMLQGELEKVLQTLSEREAGVIRMRFGLTDGRAWTLDEIGQVYGVTRERIRQIESKTMSKLRHPARSHTLRDYLD